jgi:hypothetical protein
MKHCGSPPEKFKNKIYKKGEKIMITGGGR